MYFYDRFNKIVDSLVETHHTSVEQRGNLLQTAAMLILAEEIYKLTTTASALATATANLGNTFTQLNQDFNTAWPVIQAALQNPGGTPQADIDNAIQSMNALSGNLQQLDTDFKSVGAPATQQGTVAPVGQNPVQPTA